LHPARPILARKGRCQGRFDPMPRHSTSEHRQRVSEIDSLIQSSAEM
jgi:hypothetical protein